MKHRPVCDFNQESCQPFYLEGAAAPGRRHGVLLLHGFTGTAAHMRPLAEALQRRGFTVMGINLPGHGTRMEDMARCSWTDWIDAAKDAFMQLQARSDFVSVAGLSMGGCLALILGETMQPAAVAALSAPMATRGPLWAASLLSPVVRTIWWRKRRQPLDARYDVGYPGFPSRSAGQLARIIRTARRDLHAITCPVLVVQSHADQTITPDSAGVILSGISSERRAVMWLEDTPHVCTLSGELETIADALAEHFRWAETPM